MARKRGGKKRAQKQHTYWRSLERFGMVFDTAEAIRKIQSGRARFVKRQSNRVTLWALEMGGKEVVAVYDKLRHTIATVMPNTYGY